MASTALKVTMGVLVGVSALAALQDISKSSAPALPERTEAAAIDRVKATPEPAKLPSGSDGTESKQHTAADLAPSETSKPKPIRMTDLDDADRLIRLAINLNGYLCAKPIEVRPAGNDLYGVRCIMYRSGQGRANYLVNTRTNEVSEI